MTTTKMESPKTEAEALEQCLMLWEEIVNRSCTKGAAAEKLGMDRFLFHCPCCEFATFGDSFEMECSGCPLWDCRDHGYLCEVTGSPYYEFLECHDNGTKMVAAIKQVIETGVKLSYGD